MADSTSGFALAAILGGVVFLYAGIRGVSVLKSLQAVIQGKSPSTVAQSQPITATDTALVTSSDTSSNSGGTVPAGSASYDSSNALQKLWTSNGGPQNTAAFAAKVAMAESGGSATVTSSNPDGGTNVGIWQLDTKGVGAGHTVAELQNANLNAQITIAATGGGVNWREWGDPVTAAVGYHYTPGSPV